MPSNITEIGPIRPPSESHSLLIRLSRNCPWNKCLFCPVYKNERFSVRKTDDILREILYLSNLNNRLINLLKAYSFFSLSQNLHNHFNIDELNDAHRVLHWRYHKSFNIFLQDADPLLRQKEDIYTILSAINKAFPEINRITTYGRASTLTRFSLDDFKALKSYKLLRIHTGLESGSQNVLDFVKKGVTKTQFLRAGKNLKASGIEFSLYVMPGLGGKKFSLEHVYETASLINETAPDFIRFRTLALNESIPLYHLFESGDFEILSEEDMVKEIKTIIENIHIQTHIFSDHNLNLLMEVTGKLPDDKAKILTKIDKFLNLPEEIKIKFIIARRLNLVFELSEFLSNKPPHEVETLYDKISLLSADEREKIFLKLRSTSL